MPSPAAAVTSAFAYGVARVVGGDECGNDAERDAGDERGDQGEADDRKIHRHLVQPWYRDPIAHEREQATMAKCRDAQARNAAAGGEHQALRQHLTHQPSTPGTKRGTQPDLALSRRAARQQQVRDVDAADEQHQSNRGHEREQCRADLSDHLLLEWKEHHRAPRVALGEFPLEIGEDGSHVARRLRERYAVAKSRDGV